MLKSNVRAPWLSGRGFCVSAVHWMSNKGASICLGPVILALPAFGYSEAYWTVQEQALIESVVEHLRARESIAQRSEITSYFVCFEQLAPNPYYAHAKVSQFNGVSERHVTRSLRVKEDRPDDPGQELLSSLTTVALESVDSLQSVFETVDPRLVVVTDGGRTLELSHGIGDFWSGSLRREWSPTKARMGALEGTLVWGGRWLSTWLDGAKDCRAFEDQERGLLLIVCPLITTQDTFSVLRLVFDRRDGNALRRILHTSGEGTPVLPGLPLSPEMTTALPPTEEVCQSDFKIERSVDFGGERFPGLRSGWVRALPKARNAGFLAYANLAAPGPGVFDPRAVPAEVGLGGANVMDELTGATFALGDVARAQADVSDYFAKRAAGEQSGPSEGSQDSVIKRNIIAVCFFGAGVIALIVSGLQIIRKRNLNRGAAA